MFKSIVISLFIFVGHSYGREVKSIPLSKANNDFSLKLVRHLNDDQKNVFFSPFSIFTAFGILYPGAKGKTAEELRETLGYNSAKISDEQISEQFSEVLDELSDNKTKKYDFIVANKIMAQKDTEIIDSFKEKIEKYFKFEIELRDFSEDGLALLLEINEWVSQTTKLKIREIMSEPLDPMTQMVILNAIYFKGVFQTKFDKMRTREEVFFNGGETETKVKMMKRIGKFNYTKIDGIDSKLLEIPYSGDDISLYIVLPNQRQGLKQLIDKLKDISIIEESIGKLKSVTEMMVMVPKFKIESQYSLKEKLSDLGMKSLFDKSADLSAINGRNNLYVSDAIHKAYVEVNEEGTEAAAVTAIRIQAKSMPFKSERKPFFIADHPFLFFIRNNRNGIILFFGNINRL